MHQQTLPFTGRAYHAGREQKKFPQLKGVNRSFFRCHSTRKRNNMQQLISNYRTMVLFRGIAAVLFGIIALVWPHMTLSVLVFVFGVFAVISGITAVAAALRNTEFLGWGFLFFEASWVSWLGRLPWHGRASQHSLSSTCWRSWRS